MAYSTSSPPSLLAQGIGSSVGATATAGKLWFYQNTDAVTAVRVSGYFTNGYSLGMRKGDLLMYVKSDASPLSMQLMICNEATKSGATETVDFSDGTAITATDSD
jgi:hypothetical protein